MNRAHRYRVDQVETVARALAALGAEHALVFANAAGGDELLPFGSTWVAEVLEERVVKTYALRPADFGLPEEPRDALAGGDANRNAAILRAVLSGERGAPRTAVLMNAAAALVAAGKVRSLREGVDAAIAAIDGGLAAQVLERLAAISRGEATAA
jgi:anthranilate phosphoribosyltransferase